MREVIEEFRNNEGGYREEIVNLNKKIKELQAIFPVTLSKVMLKETSETVHDVWEDLNAREANKQDLSVLAVACFLRVGKENRKNILSFLLQNCGFKDTEIEDIKNTILNLSIRELLKTINLNFKQKLHSKLWSKLRFWAKTPV